MKRILAANLGLAGLLILSACGSSSNSTQPPSPRPTAPRVITVKLAHMPTGTVTMIWDKATGTITADIDMYGFTPHSQHAMHIHKGSCLNQQNPPVIPFPDIGADAAGTVKASVVSQRVATGIPTSAYLNIHLAPGAQLGAPGGVNFTPIACADVPAGAAAAGPVALKMQATPQSGQHPEGTAVLTFDGAGHTLSVEVKASGLPAGSAHAEHIHAGSCMGQGPVLHPLNELKADAEGNADATTTVTGVADPAAAGTWYVNVHMGPANGILAGATPTLLFDPILCGNVGQ